jgi:acylphosphatase
MARYHIVIIGTVQEVGFRYFIYHSAVKLGLTGWVRNCYDGSVELEVQGEMKYIHEFIREIIKGNGFSKVDDMTSTVIYTKESEKGFRVTY